MQMHILGKLLIPSAVILLLSCSESKDIRYLDKGRGSLSGATVAPAPAAAEQQAVKARLTSPSTEPRLKAKSFGWIGLSVQGKPIRTFFWGHGQTCVYILGAIHGNESSTMQLVERIWKLLQQNKYQKFEKAITFIVVPCLNPDGVELHRRTNANGVDLNRNFPTSDFSGIRKFYNFYGGRGQGLQPETMGLLELCTVYPPALVYSIHQPLNLINFDGPAQTVALEISRLNGMRIKDDIGYNTPGSLGTYFGKMRNVPVITLELPHTGQDTAWEDLLNCNANAIITSALTWQARRRKHLSPK
jgi:protein MpaA